MDTVPCMRPWFQAYQRLGNLPWKGLCSFGSQSVRAQMSLSNTTPGKHCSGSPCLEYLSRYWEHKSSCLLTYFIPLTCRHLCCCLSWLLMGLGIWMETWFPIDGPFLSSRIKVRAVGGLRTVMSLEEELWASSSINSWEARVCLQFPRGSSGDLFVIRCSQ